MLKDRRNSHYKVQTGYIYLSKQINMHTLIVPDI